MERLLFSFMGPPQLGSGNAPAASPRPAAPGATCAACGLAYDAHEVVRDPGLTYSRCRSDRAV